ncbi:amino acid ABC transporter substrate-binding protein [Halalkalibacterium halodurans]|uniref:Amino acid ABC transporter (Amino acid-binding protein) n=1 Tax=Halalkalibacterium halodurans (strain ATCC BAA-125 / DSM 18197 / FERM 7344 / JCM 9153 / C-125) TaxID=272558 RepID=Q9KGD3_HALH5|nr:amino acid ABC transporter substrate-binding protein [Halalkalibacterium halodurans]MED4081274.1 amino acid ABC transporter substrate-binding protein [Halalkalibacterium halodurans]MED4083989.1 amino acid ABC transporter substrate-binding protein [Halalkalibacterium halodurans]MED4106006.1 amino acid ABC transporter substrate-binding protein [Halalkalibacterium halodurans]MED4107320.1 amino acid ABC transporter substrate-binding protein [Halalkalibacterium halodurans]MED4125865.1 amino acid
MKKILSMVALFFAFTTVLAACGAADQNNEETAGEEEAAEASDSLLAKVQAEGKLLIGTEGTYPPFTFHDESGELTGFDVELAREVADRLGVEADFMETQWDAMFAGLDAERFDMIANQVGIREDRLEKYDFSDHYITSTAVVVTHEDNDEINSFEDIEGKKSAQSLTSNYADLAREYNAEIVGVDGFNQAIELLNSKRVDVTINDNLSVLDFLNNRPNAPIKMVAEHEDAAQSGFMFRKGNEELVEAVNEALAEIIEDGTYEDISKKWFGEDVLN